VIRKLALYQYDNFDQNFVSAWQRNLRFIYIIKGSSGFCYILICVIYLTLGCSPQDQPASSNATPVKAFEPNQLPTNKSDSAAINSATQAAGSNAISGRVFFKGQAPPPKLIRMNQDAACVQEEETQAYSEEVAINSDGTLANVFVYIREGLRRQRYEIPQAPVILDQRHCRYTPHVFGIQVGQTLKILNSDPTFHNVHASAQKNKTFNLGMSKVEKMKTRTFDQTEVMIPLRCNVHPWMSAYAGVLDHPFYSVTDSTGSYKLQAVPAGACVIAAWHEVFGSIVQEIKLAENETKTLDFIFTRR